MGKEIAHHVHAGHERPFDHLNRPAFAAVDFLTGLFSIFNNKLCNAMHQGMLKALLHIEVSPLGADLFFFAFVFKPARKLDHPLCSVCPAIENNIFNVFTKLGIKIFVYAQLTGIHNAHGHTGLYSVIQKYSVNRLACRVVTAKRKAHIRNTTRDLGVGQIGANPLGRLNEIDGIGTMFFNACGNRKDVGVKNNVFRRKPNLLG